MKRFFVVFIICAMFSVAAFSQIKELKVTPPRFTGIDEVTSLLDKKEPQLINDYLKRNFQYPGNLDGVNFHEGTELVRFTVLPTGELTDFIVINSVSPAIDVETIRVLKSTSGMWVPGTSDEKPAAMKREVSLKIKLGESEQSALEKDFLEIARSNFSKASETFLDRGKPKRALKYYDKGIMYRPNDHSLLFMRGMCRYEVDDKEGARKDWNRLKALGGGDYESFFFSQDIRDLKGFDEMADILNKTE